MNDTLLAVFAKHWTPGAVKTRLAADIGHDDSHASDATAPPPEAFQLAPGTGPSDPP